MTIHRLVQRERGQALAELAFTVPVLALVLFALIEFGLMLNDQIAIVNASRDGARVAALQAGEATQTSDVQTAVTSAQTPLISCSPTASSPSIASSTNALGGTQVASWTVQVACTYSPFTPLGSLFALIPGGTTGSSSCSGGGFTICQSTTMRDPSCNPPTCNP